MEMDTATTEAARRRESFRRDTTPRSFRADGPDTCGEIAIPKWAITHADPTHFSRCVQGSNLQAQIGMAFDGGTQITDNRMSLRHNTTTLS